MRGGRLVVVALLAITATGCAFSGLNFVQDERLDIVEPTDRAEVELPVTIAWTVEDFEYGPDAGSFGVFVDRAPPPPNKSIEWMFRDDDACQVLEGCPDAQYLADRGIYPTTGTSVTIERIPRLADSDRHDFHEAIVVLFDEQGERIGESAWSVDFELVTPG